MRRLWILMAMAGCGCNGGPAEAASRPTAEAATAEPPGIPVSLDERFWDHWGDGRAELAGYRLQTPRYGEIRDGKATLVFVTETFTHGQRVKSDGGHPDEYPVLKLNLVRDFQTGIYDYNVMTSSFHRLDGVAAAGEPVKVSMSMQEWCGHVYEQLVPEGEALTWTSHSYFDGEADQRRDLGRRREAIALDALPVMVRGLLGPVVEPGESITRAALPTLVEGRLRHVRPEWTELTLSRASEPEQVEVPAGTFQVDVYESVVTGGVATTWYVERAWPHRLVKWRSSHGEIAEMLGSERLAYWQEHNNGDEALLREIGHDVPAVDRAEGDR